MVQPKYNPQEALERVKLMMNYDLSKTSTENKKVIEEQKTEEKGRFSCIKNYYKSKNVPYKEYSYKSGRGKGLMVDLPNETWFFDVPSKSWRKLVVANFVEKGKWECDGNVNFIITKNDGTVYKSSDSNVNPQPAQTQPVAQPAQIQPVAQPAQTQPVAQPAQTQPKADNKQDTPDPSKPQKLRPKDSPLGTTLKDTSIPKRTCIAFINQFHDTWKRCPKGVDSPDPSCKKEKEIIQQREYVQRCMNEYFPYPKEIGEGNWGIAGLVSKKIDENLFELSACKSPAPAQTKADSIFRLSRKCP
jgi:hypothetical protein